MFIIVEVWCLKIRQREEKLDSKTPRPSLLIKSAVQWHQIEMEAPSTLYNETRMKPQRLLCNVTKKVTGVTAAGIREVSGSADFIEWDYNGNLSQLRVLTVYDEEAPKH